MTTGTMELSAESSATNVTEIAPPPNIYAHADIEINVTHFFARALQSRGAMERMLIGAVLQTVSNHPQGFSQPFDPDFRVQMPPRETRRVTMLARFVGRRLPRPFDGLQLEE